MSRSSSRSLRLLVLGQASSLFGSAILRLALAMYVLEATGSAAVFAGMLAAAGVPSLLLAPLGGAVADRADKRRMMVTLDLLNGLFSAVAAVLLPRWQGLAVAGGLLVALSVLGAFETPVVQSCLPAILSGDSLVRGNAAVSQTAAVAALAAPALGGALYAALGIGPVLWASAACFLLTALLECFLQIPAPARRTGEALLPALWEDSKKGIRYLRREGADLLGMLLLAAAGNFFVTGAVVVGLPYLTRSVLALGPGWYGGAESAMAAAAIAGSAWAGLTAGGARPGRLSRLFAAIGAALLPAGVLFLFPAGPGLRYAGLVLSCCGMQWAVSAFSVLAVSLIQQRTPMAMMGRVMACVSAATLCAQPLGQLLYGLLFDGFRELSALVLLPTAGAVWALGIASGGLLRRLEED